MTENEKILKEVNEILAQVSNVLAVERSTFFLYNEENKTLESVVAQGIENLIIAVPLGTGIVGHVFETQQPLAVNDVYAHPLFASSFDNQLNFKTKSILCVPIFNENKEIIGALQCLNKKNDSFSTTDITVLNSFATAISLIIKNSKLYHTSEHLKNNISKLLEVFKAVSSELNLNKLIQLIMNKAAEITNSDRSSLFLVDEITGELWTVFAKGLDNTIVRTKKGIVAKVAKTKAPLIVNDPYNHPDFNPAVDLKTKYKTNSILSVPVFNSEKEVLGVVQVINKNDGEFHLDDLNILTGFASQIKIAIENAKLFDQIEGMKNYLNILVQNLDNGIVTIDANRKIKTINSRFFSMFNVDDSFNLEEKHIEDVNATLQSLFSYAEETIKSGEKTYFDDIEIQIESQKFITVNISALPMENAKGEKIGVIMVFNDISKEKRIQSNLSRYIPQHLVKEVMNKDNLSLLKGNYSKCSILFSDIRNFTTLTEEFGAMEIVKLLNNYFEAMITSVYKFDGILDKFIGDAIMTVFGVPYANISDSKNAVRCALDMFEKLKELNKNQDTTTPKVNIGIGISTGNVVSGNIGSEKRFEYTVIGDSVNIAARLESATKIYNVDLLICEQTYQEIKDEFYCREIDTLLVKGKNIPVNIYTVLKPKTAFLSEEEQSFLHYFSEGLSKYKVSNYQEARVSFQKAKALQQADGPTKTFLERCNNQLLEISNS